MRALLFAMLCWTVGAQDSPVLRGIVVRRELSVRSGVLTVRAGDLVVKFHFDGRTYVERDNRPIEGAQLRPGEQVEVVSDAVSGTELRNAQSIHVIPVKLVERHRPPLEKPKGDLTFSGLILRLGNGRMMLHRREEGDIEILLRPDTRYMVNGDLVSAENLKTNMRVEVRAARDVAGKVEAYQVVWGSMLAPK